jgi:hypothetical protein
MGDAKESITNASTKNVIKGGDAIKDNVSNSSIHQRSKSVQL